MSDTLYLAHATELVRHRTGVAIPVFFKPGEDHGLGLALLRDTVATFVAHVVDPGRVLLVVDGKGNGETLIADICKEFNVPCHAVDTNRGKLNPVREGARELLKQADIEYFTFVDQDGDHTANDLYDFVRLAEHIRNTEKTERIHILGRRQSKMHPMGLGRGQLEDLADRLLVDCFHYHAAQTGTPFDMRYATLLEEFPDFHSGYKMLSRQTAQDILCMEPQLAGAKPDAYYRYGVEAVICVEAYLSGATLGVVNRSTINEQPVSTFGKFNRIELVSQKIIWPFKRLNIPSAFIQQWIANHIPRLLLTTLAPEGKTEILAIQNEIHRAFDLPEVNSWHQPLML